jgi:hypothetical protein
MGEYTYRVHNLLAITDMYILFAWVKGVAGKARNASLAEEIRRLFNISSISAF